MAELKRLDRTVPRRGFVVAIILLCCTGLAGQAPLHTLCHLWHVHCSCTYEEGRQARQSRQGRQQVLGVGEAYHHGGSDASYGVEHTCYLCSSGAGLGVAAADDPPLLAGRTGRGLVPSVQTSARIGRRRLFSARAPPPCSLRFSERG